MLTVYQDADLQILEGLAEQSPDFDVDLVLTNPYGRLPAWARTKPMLVHQWRHRKAELARWCGLHPDQLAEVSGWNDDREVFWCVNMPVPKVNLHHLRPEDDGWYPLELPLRLLNRFGAHWLASRTTERPMVVWDGFMGRGTVAQACRILGHRYIGVERLPEHIAIARTYLKLPTTS